VSRGAAIRRQPGGWVQRQHAHSVERHRASEDPGSTEREVRHARATMRKPDQIIAQALGS
jgi:hypothetical protein